MYNNTPIPHQATKIELRRWYRKIPTRTLNQVIKAAVKAQNEIATIPTSKRAHVLNKHHLKFIFEELGRPKI